MLKLKQIFNLDCQIPIKEQLLRKKFSQIMELANERLEKSVIFDQQILIIIENIECVKEDELDRESLIKYWLPKYFPNRFRTVITTNKNSSADDYFQYLSEQNQCSLLNIRSSKPQEEILIKKIQKYWHMNKFNKKIIHIW